QKDPFIQELEENGWVLHSNENTGVSFYYPRDNFSIENIETYTIVKNKRTFSDEESVALVFSTDTIEDISKVSTKINEPATGDWETVQVGEESFNVRKLSTGELRSQLSTDPCMYKRTIDAYYITDSTQDITITSYDK